MKNIIKFGALLFICFIFVLSISYAQKIETVDGVRIVHNDDKGQWGKNPQVDLEFIKTIGRPGPGIGFCDPGLWDHVDITRRRHRHRPTGDR